MTNLERLQAAYTAWNETKGGSRNLFGEFMADRFELRHVDDTQPGMSFAKNSMTRAEALVYLGAIFEQWEMEYYRPETFVEQGPHIAMFGSCAFIHKRTKKRAEMTMAVLWRFEGDKAVSIREVYDTAVAAAAATG